MSDHHDQTHATGTTDMSDELEGRLDDILANEVEPGEGEWADVVPMPSGEDEPTNHSHQLSGDKPANA